MPGASSYRMVSRFRSGSHAGALRYQHSWGSDSQCLKFRSSFEEVVNGSIENDRDDYTAALSEIHRVLGKGGVAVIAVPMLMSAFLIGKRLVSVTVGPLWRTAKRVFGPKGLTRQPTPLHHRNPCVPWRFRRLLREMGFRPERDDYSAFTIYPLDRFPNLNVRVAELLQPSCPVPLLRSGASVYMEAARRT